MDNENPFVNKGSLQSRKEYVQGYNSHLTRSKDFDFVVAVFYMTEGISAADSG